MHKPNTSYTLVYITMMAEVVAAKESPQRRKNQIFTMKKEAKSKISCGPLSFFTSHATNARGEGRVADK
jgi:hypothetical protein